MIVRHEPGRLTLILQHELGLITSRLAGAWGNDLFRAPEPPGPVQAAATVYAQGFAAWEREPMIDLTTGKPYDFLHLPATELIDVCQRGTRLANQIHPYAGFLVSLHLTGLLRQRYGWAPPLFSPRVDSAQQAQVDEYLATMRPIQWRWLAQQDIGSATVWTHYCWLQLWDLLVLALAYGWAADHLPLTLGVVPLYPAGPERALQLRRTHADPFTIDPWPFRLPQLELTLPVYYIPDRRYQSDADLLGTFRSAPAGRITYILQRSDTE